MPSEESDQSLGMPASGIKMVKGLVYEPRTFMYCNYLFHTGLSQIQYKTFFHMCRLESISFDMESRTGSTFSLYDSMQSGVLGMLTIGKSRHETVKNMMDAMNFIQNQAGAMTRKTFVLNTKEQDSLQIGDIVQRIKTLHRTYDKQLKEGHIDVT